MNSVALPDYAIVTGDLVRTGGMDRANLALASYLLRQGHVVHAVAHRIDDELSQHPKLVFHRVPKPANSYFFAGPLLNRAGRRVGNEIIAGGGRVVVNGGNCVFGDINWVHYVHAAYQPTNSGGIARKVKTTWSHRAFSAAESKSLRLARIVIANSNRTRQDLIDRVGVPADRIRTIYLGTDPDAFFPPSEQQRAELRAQLDWPVDRPIAIFIGAPADRRKGFDTLFAAWIRLCRSSTWDVNLAVVGHGADLDTWKQRVADAGIASRIHFLGFRKDVPDLLRASDVLVAPARYEPYGLGVQEALCCGLPALVSANAGVAERYPENLKSLLLPDCEDIAGLVSSLTAWRTEINVLRIAAKLLGDILRTRSWDQTAKEIVNAVAGA